MHGCNKECIQYKKDDREQLFYLMDPDHSDFSKEKLIQIKDILDKYKEVKKRGRPKLDDTLKVQRKKDRVQKIKHIMKDKYDIAKCYKQNAISKEELESLHTICQYMTKLVQKDPSLFHMKQHLDNCNSIYQKSNQLFVENYMKQYKQNNMSLSFWEGQFLDSPSISIPVDSNKGTIIYQDQHSHKCFRNNQEFDVKVRWFEESNYLHAVSDKINGLFGSFNGEPITYFYIHAIINSKIPSLVVGSKFIFGTKQVHSNELTNQTLDIDCCFHYICSEDLVQACQKMFASYFFNTLTFDQFLYYCPKSVHYSLIEKCLQKSRSLPLLKRSQSFSPLTCELKLKITLIRCSTQEPDLEDLFLQSLCYSLHHQIIYVWEKQIQLDQPLSIDSNGIILLADKEVYHHPSFPLFTKQIESKQQFCILCPLDKGLYKCVSKCIKGLSNFVSEKVTIRS